MGKGQGNKIRWLGLGERWRGPCAPLLEWGERRRNGLINV